jgi:shikimate kinase
LTGFGEALAHGAATIINAIATGKGAAFGVDLWTRAEVSLTGETGVVAGRILSDAEEDDTLIREAVLTVLRHYNLAEQFGADVVTSSNIPIARGLKSSSVAANAIILATVAALGRSTTDLEAINLGVKAALSAKTTITGAFDDACASFFGGVVVTDNLERRILKRFTVDEEYTVLFYVPGKRVYTYMSNVKRMRLIAPQVTIAFREALAGNYWNALTLNGLLYTAALGYDPQPAIEALECGAVASGLSGTGPSTVAVTTPEEAESIFDAWRIRDGEVIRAALNHEKATIIRAE